MRQWRTDDPHKCPNLLAGPEVLMLAKAGIACLSALTYVVPSGATVQAMSVPVSLARMEFVIAVDYENGALEGTAHLRLRNHERYTS